MTPRAGRAARFAAAFGAVLAADQATKALARRALSPDGDAVTAVPGLFDFRLVFNRGAAFSMGEGLSWLFVAAAAAIIAACAAYAVLGSPGKGLCAALGALAGGGAGNLIDRAASGCVTDFIMATFVRFPVFNLADVAITCGAAAAFILLWRQAGASDADGGRPGGR